MVRIPHSHFFSPVPFAPSSPELPAPSPPRNPSGPSAGQNSPAPGPCGYLAPSGGPSSCWYRYIRTLVYIFLMACQEYFRAGGPFSAKFFAIGGWGGGGWGKREKGRKGKAQLLPGGGRSYARIHPGMLGPRPIICLPSTGPHECGHYERAGSPLRSLTPVRARGRMGPWA